MEKASQIAIGIGALALVFSAVSVYTVMQMDTEEQVDQLSESQVEEIAEDIAEDYSREGEPLYTGTGLGFTIEFSNEDRHYHSGDTHATWEMENYINEHVNPDVSYISGGNVYTPDLETAGWMASLVDANDYSVPHHYGTFPFLDQDFEEFEDSVNNYRDEGETETEALELESGEEWDHNGVSVTYVGHSTFIFEDPSGFTLAIDPWINTNPEAPEDWVNNPEAWPEIDMILLTHGHLDHYTPGTVEDIQEMHDAPVVAEWELVGHMTNQGFENVHAVNDGANIDKEILEGMGATGAIDEMPENMRIWTHSTEHSSSPATALGAEFGIVEDDELDY